MLYAGKNRSQDKSQGGRDGKMFGRSRELKQGATTLANLGSSRRIMGRMRECFQSWELNGLRCGDQQVSRHAALIEGSNWLERELRETLVQEFAGILPQLKGQPETPVSLLAGRLEVPTQRFNEPTGRNHQLKSGLKNQSFDISTHTANGLKRCKSLMLHQLRHKQRLGTPDDIPAAQQRTIEMNTKQVQEINEPEFETEVLRCTQPVLVGFLAGWSRPSQLIESVLDEAAAACNSSARIFKVNVDDNPDLGAMYSIQSIPTLLYFFKGTVCAKIVGTASAKAILAKFNSLTPCNTSTTDVEPSRG